MRTPAGVLLALAALAAWPLPSVAIPVFARRYRTTCLTCHNVIPALNPVGEMFAANGFRFAARGPARDTVATGDPLLTLLEDLPLAVRLDMYVQAYNRGEALRDLQVPYALKVLSSGELSSSLSWYFYAYLFERGEVGGVEDAFLVWNDALDMPVDLSVGQFQVSDPMFKRELRLEYEDYAIYRVRVGESPVTLTYDRGLMAAVDLLGFGLTGELVNGNGKGPASEDDRQFDNDALKNVAVHVTRDLPLGLRLGGFGYYGETESDGVRDRTTYLGVDGTWSGGWVEVNAQYLHREDDAPLYTTGGPTVETDGGFVELLLRPVGRRWYGFALYNLVDANRPLLDVGLGGPPNVNRYETGALGVGWLVRRNLRTQLEAGWDFQQEEARWTFGLVTAF